MVPGGGTEELEEPVRENYLERGMEVVLGS